MNQSMSSGLERQTKENTTKIPNAQYRSAGEGIFYNVTISFTIFLSVNRLPI